MFCTINIVRFHIPVLAKSCGYFANIIISIQFKCTYFTSSTGATQLSTFLFYFQKFTSGCIFLRDCLVLNPYILRIIIMNDHIEVI